MLFFVGDEYYTCIHYHLTLLDCTSIGKQRFYFSLRKCRETKSIRYVWEHVDVYNVYGCTRIFQARLPLYSIWTFYCKLWLIIWGLPPLNRAKAKQIALPCFQPLQSCRLRKQSEIHSHALVKHKAWFITSWLLQFQRYQCLEDPQNAYPLFFQIVQGTK